MIKYLKNNFDNIVIGYSDHTLPDNEMSVLQLSFLFGAQIIEKHFTLDKSLLGNDHYHAMDEKDLKIFISKIDSINELSGKEKKIVLKSEEAARTNARRSIVIRKDLKKGSVIKEKDIISKRPGLGISPIHWSSIIGRKIIQDLKKDHILKFDDLID